MRDGGILRGFDRGSTPSTLDSWDDERHLHFLITRLSHIGDCILAMPILNALRVRFPGARIDWVVERPSACLLEGHAALDRLIVLPRGWMKSPRAVWSVFRTLRAGKYDVAVDPQSLTKSAVLGRLSGARTRIGFAGADGRELSRWLNNRLVARTQEHMVARGLELLRPLGIVAPEVRFGIPIPESARQMVAGYLGAAGLGGRFVAINPGAGWDSRLWPADRYAAVAARLGRDRAVPSVVVWAGDRERGWAEAIVAQSQGHATLAPPTSLLELAALLERASLYLGSDTGPMHVAVAVGTRCVSLHGPTPAAKSGPFGPGHRAIQEVCLEGSSRHRRGADNEAMKAILPDRVAAACEELLSGPPAPARRAA